MIKREPIQHFVTDQIAGPCEGCHRYIEIQAHITGDYKLFCADCCPDCARAHTIIRTKELL